MAFIATINTRHHTYTPSIHSHHFPSCALILRPTCSSFHQHIRSTSCSHPFLPAHHRIPFQSHPTTPPTLLTSSTRSLLISMSYEKPVYNIRPKLNKVFVGNLSWAISEDDLLDCFDRFGQVVEARIVTDRDSGRSRGFGFVTFDSEEEAQRAVDAMNGKELEGREIRVTLAERRERAPKIYEDSFQEEFRDTDGAYGSRGRGGPGGRQSRASGPGERRQFDEDDDYMGGRSASRGRPSGGPISGSGSGSGGKDFGSGRSRGGPSSRSRPTRFEDY